MFFKIREATPKDLQEVLELEYRCFPDPYPLSLLNRLRSMYPDTFLVVEHGGRIVGYVIAALRWGNVGHILAIGVDPPLRRRGMGSALIKETLTRFRRKGAGMVRLEVRKSNLVAQQFYRKLGFIDRFDIPYYYEDGESAITMELPL